MSKRDYEDWRQKKDLSKRGFVIKPSAIRIHNSDETPKHLMVKAMLALVLQRKDRSWDTEVSCDAGRADVYDAGPIGEKAMIYEVETGVTKAQRKKKSEQYTGGPIRDTIVIDPADVPNDPTKAVEWLEKNVVIG